VLILVIALLVLLALIGTAFLTTTQTERYTAGQNSVNTEADLLIAGIQNSVAGQLASGLFAGVPNGLQYRPPSQEMPLPTVTYPVNFNNFDSTSSNLLMGQRVPTNTDPRTFLTINWSSISWPLAPDGSGNYVFDSPFGGRVNTYIAANRSKIVAIPYYGTFNGTIYPAMILYVPPVAPGTTGFQTPTGTYTSGAYITPYGITTTAPIFPTGANGGTVASYLNYAGDASGTGVADSCFYKIPGGPINGITYYAATRVVDNNSAINASTAWTMASDPGSPLTQGGTGTTTSGPNFNFFRSGVGLLEMLSPTYGGNELATLNGYREVGQLPTGTTTPQQPTIIPADDPGALGGSPASTVSQYAWWSLGDYLDHQLARRPGNPGYANLTTQFPQCKWPGPTETAALAYKAGLINPYTSPSILEQCLAADVYSNPSNASEFRSTPYAPNQVAPVGSPYAVYSTAAGYWFNDMYNYYHGPGSGTAAYTGMPARNLLTANNAVSIATPSRLGNAGASVVPVWSGTTQYHFGDWVKDTTGRSYVCVQANTGQPLPNPYNLPTRYWTSEPFTTQPVKTSINTANFQQLYLGFAQVMADSQNSSTVVPPYVWEPPMKYPAATPEPQLPMFRSVLRNRTLPLLRPDQMLQLRAAQAAVNAMDLRDSDDNVTSRHITLMNTDGVTPQYEVEVYGAEKQPYISEVFIHLQPPSAGGGGGGGTGGNYMAVKLCNPYHTPVTLTNWRFGIVNRSGTAITMNTSIAIPSVTIPAAGSGPSAGIPGIITLEDSASNEPIDVSATMANNFLIYGQTGTPKPTTASPAQVPGLCAAAFGNEMVLMRPRRADGQLSTSTDPTDTYTEGNPSDLVGDLVPVDQLDMSGLIGPTQQSDPPVRYLYRRACRGDQGVHKAWNMVFPGNYATGSVTAIATLGHYGQSKPGSTTPYYYGGPVAIPAMVEDSSDGQMCNLNAPDGLSPDSQTPYNPDPLASTFPTVSIQIANTFMAGPNPLNSEPLSPTSTANTFPFGGFARNGDMMQIPFIGSYRITNETPTGNPTATHNQLVELNSVSMDSALGNDNTLGTTDLNQPTLTWQTSGSTETMSVPLTEQIGRFCPVGDPLQGSPGANPVNTAGMDFFEPASTAQADVNAAAQYWHYHWTRKLFDYFTVQCPADDYAPDVDPAGPNGLVTPNIPAKYPDLDATPNGLPVKPVGNTTSTITNDVTPGTSEDQAGVEGLININTAPWPVLASVAWVPVGTHLSHYNLVNDSLSGGQTADDNTAIAQAIVAYRLKYGPFKSIEDLLKVPAVSTEMQQFLQTAPACGQGLFSPSGIGTTANPAFTSGVRFDFSERYLLINRVSNIVTTHSDNYTCYVLLQGWRNVDTSNPTLAVQRRAAFLVDRTNVNASNSKPTTFKIPTD
jgi:hypothetical protein